MSRRPDSDRIVTARREAQLARLRSAGLPGDRAVVLLREVEQTVLASGLDRRTRPFWDAVAAAVGERVGPRA